MLEKYETIKCVSDVAVVVRDWKLPNGSITLQPGQETTVTMDTWRRVRRRVVGKVASVTTGVMVDTEGASGDLKESIETLVDSIEEIVDSAVICEACGKTFKTEFGLRSHMRSHKPK